MKHLGEQTEAELQTLPRLRGAVMEEALTGWSSLLKSHCAWGMPVFHQTY